GTRTMKTLYTKFILYTIGIMILSFTLTFILINSFYHQQFKKTNDEKYVTIAENVASFIEENKNLSLDSYLQSVANNGYKLFLVSDSYETKSFGEAFRRENLDNKAVQNVL